MKYAVVEISGKQHVVYPGKTLEVENFAGEGEIECDKVIMISQDGKISLGAPYLKDKLKIKVSDGRKTKIRVAKFHAKSNTRKVIGQKRITKRIALV